MSANGRYVVFSARSAGFAGVWIKDRAKPDKPAWRLAAGTLGSPDISADGEYVAWVKYGSGGAGQAVYVLHWQHAGAAPELVSLGDDGQGADAAVDNPSLSRTGRYVAFQSDDPTLDNDVTPGAGSGGAKVYVRDRALDETEMVSLVDLTTGDQVVDGAATKPDITPDGRYVAFASDAPVLQGVTDGSPVHAQVYLRDRSALQTLPVSVAAAGTAFGDAASATRHGPTVSSDGSRVAFESDATNLVAGDTNGDTDAFVRNLRGGATTRVSLDHDGKQVDLASPTAGIGLGPVISGDGRFVAFESEAALTPDDDNAVQSTCQDGSGTHTGVVEVADVYRAGPGGSLVRQSVIDHPADPQAFEATGYRLDDTGTCVAASNGSDAAINWDGSRVAFVSEGNLTGHPVVEGLTADAVTSIDPAVYLRGLGPQPDVTAPTSKASSPAYANKPAFLVKYTSADRGEPCTGVASVALYVLRPGATAFTLVKTDTGADRDGAFWFRSGGANGRYRFATVATDVAGNVEKLPATADTVTVLDTVHPLITHATASPRPFDLSRDHVTVLSMRISERALTRFVILHQGVAVRHFPAVVHPRGLVTQRWAGRNDAGHRVHNGWYAARMRAVDLAGNVSGEVIYLHVTR